MEKSKSKKSPMIVKLASMAAVLAGLTLAGCVETRFEAPLGDNIETCDAHWKGLWFDADDTAADRERGVTAFHVNDDCEFTLIEQPEPHGALKRIHVPMNYVHAGGSDYLVVSEAALRGLVDLKPPYDVDPPPPKTFFFARYRIRGERIEVFPVDSAKTAKLVIDGTTDGTVQKGRNELHVFIRGGRAQMLALVHDHDIFESKPAMTFVRSKQDIDTWERSLPQAAKEKR
jgi:outer membrane murein-binding lipoprotein Lpp